MTGPTVRRRPASPAGSPPADAPAPPQPDAPPRPRWARLRALWRWLLRRPAGAPPADASPPAAPASPPDEDVLAGAGAMDAGAPPPLEMGDDGLPEGAGTVGDDEKDIRILPFVVLHRSRMHAVDMRRELDRFAGEDGRLRLRRGEVRSRLAYRVDVVIQVAAELALGGAEMRSRLAAEPAFLRLAHDAVYYLSRRWPRMPVFTLSEKPTSDFVAYLAERMDDAVRGRRRTDPVRRRRRGDAPESLPADDVQFLYDRVREMARLLSDRAELDQRLKTEWRGFEDPAEKQATVALLAEVMGLDGTLRKPLIYSNGRYLWCYTTTGRAAQLDPGVEEEAQAAEDVARQVSFVRAFQRALATAVRGDAPPAAERRVDLATLSADLHVLGSSPAWSEVERALAALDPRDAAAVPDGVRKELGPIVGHFAEMLKARGDLLGSALLVGAAVGRAALAAERPETQGTPEEQMAGGLAVLAEAFGFARQDVTAMKSTLGRVGEELRGLYPGGLPDPQLPTLGDTFTASSWGRAMGLALTEVRRAAPDPAVLHRGADVSRRARVVAFLAGSSAEPRVEELALAAAEGPAAAAVKLDAASMTLVEWSKLAYSSLVDGGVKDPWLGLAALAAVGFRAQEWKDVAAWLAKLGFPRPGGRPIAVDGLPTREPPPGAIGAVVIRRAAGSITSEWRPQSRVPALAVTHEEAQAILSHLPRRRAGLPTLVPPLGVIAFEMPLDRPTADEDLLKLFRARVTADAGKMPRVVYLYPARPTDQAKTPYIPAPRGLTDLLGDPPPTAP